MFHAIKQAIKRVCPEPVLQKYYALRIGYENVRWVKSCMGHETIREIEIETINRCNGICPFCPVNVNQPQREYARMSDELFKKIINELADMNYSGKIALYSNNEPFLDERIIEFNRYANEKLPNAVFHLYTNGSLLTFEKFMEIMPLLDMLIIDNYNDKKEINTPELQKIYDYIQKDEDMAKRVMFQFRLQNEVLYSRGGQAPNKIGKFDRAMQKVLCPKPYMQFIIRPTGEISLCCNDALGKYTLGDLKTQSIQDVWTCEQYRQIRQEMFKNKRKNLKLCCECDTIFRAPKPETRNRHDMQTAVPQ